MGRRRPSLGLPSFLACARTALLPTSTPQMAPRGPASWECGQVQEAVLSSSHLGATSCCTGTWLQFPSVNVAPPFPDNPPHWGFHVLPHWEAVSLYHLGSGTKSGCPPGRGLQLPWSGATYPVWFLTGQRGGSAHGVTGFL